MIRYIIRNRRDAGLKPINCETAASAWHAVRDFQHRGLTDLEVTDHNGLPLELDELSRRAADEKAGLMSDRHVLLRVALALFPLVAALTLAPHLAQLGFPGLFVLAIAILVGSVILVLMRSRRH
jgi:fatty acid desaturase